jgi:hypothetical protein
MVTIGIASAGSVKTTIPGSVTIPAGATSGAFSVDILAVDSSTTVDIVATLNGLTKIASLPVLAPSVSIAPATVNLAGGESRQFSASITNLQDSRVLWSVSPTIGSISVTGLYTAPAVIAAAQTVSVKATSVADPSRSAVSTVTLLPPPPVMVSVSPPTSSLQAGQQQQFTAAVAGTANTAVVWSLTPAVGTISAAGLYTAPSTVTSVQSLSVRATSVADASKSAAATITLNPVPVVPPPDQDLTAYWPFSEGSGATTADQSGNGRTANVSGATWAFGYAGGGLSFNGSNSFVDAGSFDVGGNAFTLSAWFKASTIPQTDPRIISKATGIYEQDHYWMLSLTESSGARLRFRLKAGGTTRTLIGNGATVAAGQWVHAVATYDGARMRLYQNGVEIGSLAASGTLTGNAGVPVRIGSNVNNFGVFNGVIDEVRVYKRALSPSDVHTLFKGDQTPDALQTATANRID